MLPSDMLQELGGGLAMTNRGLHRRGLLYAAIPIPVLASIYDGYEAAI